jgi:hypothetical protein
VILIDDQAALSRTSQKGRDFWRVGFDVNKDLATKVP